MAVSIRELKRMADRLPDHARDGEPFHMTYCSAQPLVRATHNDLWPEPIHADRVTFRARTTLVHGVEATAWFYHDLLVKVTV